MSLFWNITRSFSYRRIDVSFILQLIWGDAIYVKLIAVSFSLSFLAWIVLLNLKITVQSAFCHRTNLVLQKNIAFEKRQKQYYYSS